MGIIETSSMRKSMTFTDDRLYAREAVYLVLQMLLSQPKGSFYETPSMGFDRRDLLFYSMGSDEYELVKMELEVMLKEVLKVQDGIEIDYERVSDDSVGFSVIVRDNLGNVTKVGTVINVNEKDILFKPIRVR
jgi:hypothetical protein